MISTCTSDSIDCQLNMGFLCTAGFACLRAYSAQLRVTATVTQRYAE